MRLRSCILGAGDYDCPIRGTGEDGSATGDLDISSELVIAGEDTTRAITIDGNHVDRVFDVLQIRQV